MKSILIQHSYDLIESWEELPEDEQTLILACREATQQAYAPYSEFFVGAAILLSDGKTIIQGSNQENAAYPSGLCAERVAYFTAGALGKGRQIAKIAITAISKTFEYTLPVSPCGACRQVMAEYEQLSQTPTTILLTSMQTLPIFRIKGVDTLLPLKFELK